MIKRSNLYRRVAAVFADHDFIVTPTLAAPPLSCDHFAWDPVVVNGRLTGGPPDCRPLAFRSRLLRIAAELEVVRPWSHLRPALVA